MDIKTLSHNPEAYTKAFHDDVTIKWLPDTKKKNL